MASGAAIVGLGVTPQGKLPGRTVDDLTAEAIERALGDSGVSRRDIGAYVYQKGFDGGPVGAAAMRTGIAARLALEIDTGGATGITSIVLAKALIEQGIASYVVCAHGTLARSRGVVVGAGEASPGGLYGLFSPGAGAALSASAYLAKYNLAPDALGPMAVALRRHGALRHDAVMYGKPIDMAAYRASDWVVSPLRRLDYCLVTDGAVALIVTSSERARASHPRAVEVKGYGFTHGLAKAHAGALGSAHDPSPAAEADFDPEPARSRAFAMAGLTLDDIDVFQFYDAFTILLAQQIEAYGLCPPGGASAFAGDGGIGFDGARPCNTSGTEHSWSYVQGFTHLAEAVRQLRGEGGATQVAGARTCLATGIGQTSAGNAHAAIILSRMTAHDG